MRTVAFIPCRLDSTRLPGKALLDVSGELAIHRLISLAERSAHLERRNIIVCTTERPSDDPLAEAVDAFGASVFRGHTDDLIDRLYQASLAYPSDIVIEIDGDDLCADPAYMDLAVERIYTGAAEVAVSGDGLPLGTGSKAFAARCLAAVHRAYVPGTNDTGFGYFLTKSGLFNVATIEPVTTAHRLPELRLTLDYPEDLEVFRRIYAAADAAGKPATLDFICGFAHTHPELLEINANLDEGYWQRTQEIMSRNPLRIRVDGDLVTIGPDA